jgi:hypothetical protein
MRFEEEENVITRNLGGPAHRLVTVVQHVPLQLARRKKAGRFF